MAASVAKVPQSNPLHSMDLRVAKASIDVHRPINTAPDSAPAFDLSLITQAIADAGMQEKEFCINAGLDQSLWSRIKSGMGNLQAKVLLSQPPKFWIVLDRLQRQKLGISEVTEQQIHDERINATADALWDRLIECFKKGTER